MDKMRINLEDLLICMSKAQDIMAPFLSNHHQRVAYLSFRLAQEIRLSIEEQREIYLAALVHDIGALSMDEKLELIENDPDKVNKHAIKGAKLLENFQPLSKASQIIKYHHVPWQYGEGRFYNGEEVPFASHVINIADYTCSLIQPDKNILSQLPVILHSIEKSKNTRVIPELVDALIRISKIEYYWLDLISNSPVKRIRDEELLNVLDLEVDDVIDFALIFSHLIDFRSSFTARHSVGVAKAAESLASLVGFSEYECKLMLIAGYLHDLGKLAISNEILDKPGKLTETEFDEIRKHTYYTYHLLEPIEAFKTINVWASYHHEKLDGTGYPFHIKGENLVLGSRVMAVADVFTAITEDRPYRKSMNDESAKKVLNDMVTSGALDGRIVSLLIDNFDYIKETQQKIQSNVSGRYQELQEI